MISSLNILIHYRNYRWSCWVRGSHHYLHGDKLVKLSSDRNCWRIRRLDDALRICALHAHSDVDLVLAELDKATAPRERLGPEAACVITDEVESSKPLGEAGVDALAALGVDVARPDEDSIKQLL